MKKFTLNIVLLSIFSLLVFTSFSQTGLYEIRIVENDLGYLDVQMREMTGGTNLPSNTDGDGINDLTFAIRWSSSLGTDVAFLCTPNPYNLTDPSNVVHTEVTNWHYRYYNANNAPYVVPDDWAFEVWQTIGTFYTTGGSGTGTFEIAPQNFGISTLNFEIGENNLPPYHAYLPIRNGGAVNYAFPTVVYNFVWVGGYTDALYDEESWGAQNNWETECGITAPHAPNTTDNCYIPSGRTYYPSNVDKLNIFNAMGGNVRIADGGQINWDDPNNKVLPISGNLDDYGVLTIKPNAAVTVSGDTYLDGVESLVVEAAYDATAGETQVGSFIDNGTITYGASGSANVQIHLYHAAGQTLWYHQVGPTVDDPAQTYSGVSLEAFNLNDVNDFAYIYDESIAPPFPPNNPWVNIFDYDEEIHTASGMMITTNLVEQHTLDMIGDLLTGTVTTDLLTYSGSYLELISNPYPSAIDFDLFFANSGNGSVINNKNWVWDETANGGLGNYLARAAGAGGVENIQVGQGFFVETVAGGTVSFENTNRVHSTDAFRDIMPNILSLDISNNATGFADALVIRFDEEGTTGYDHTIEAEKWNSMNENATMIRSIAEDGKELSVNVMPQLDLQGEMVSVPVHFQTGIDGEYTFTASELESFEYGTEIWIEDKLDGNQWHHFSIGHETYTFTANANDAHDRFIIHFFGPTGVDQFEAKNVLIYADNEYAIIRNMTKNEIVKEVSIYSLAGTKLLHKRVAEQNMYRFFVSNHDNYYIVRVVTDKNIYTEKVFVH